MTYGVGPVNASLTKMVMAPDPHTFTERRPQIAQKKYRMTQKFLGAGIEN